MKTAIAIAAFLLAGCGENANPQGYDQCMRREVFAQCMAALPKGPERVGTSNDWDEVVDSCATAAARMSVRHREHVKPECFVRSM